MSLELYTISDMFWFYTEIKKIQIPLVLLNLNFIEEFIVFNGFDISKSIFESV